MAPDKMLQVDKIASHTLGYQHLLLWKIQHPRKYADCLPVAMKESRKDSRTKEYFFINVSHRMQKVFYDDILYLEGYKDYTKLHLKSVSNPLLILHNLKYFEDLLQSHDFIRIHRSYIVSLEKLDTISRKSVSIAATILPVSDNYRDAFLAVVGHYVK